MTMREPYFAGSAREAEAIAVASRTEHPLAIPEWFTRLPVQQQSVLMLALRGPDGVGKHHPAKGVHRCYRATILRAAYYGRWLVIGERADTFMDLENFHHWPTWADEVKTFFAHVDELPHHYAAHLAHGAQILGYKHPDLLFRSRWDYFYEQWCDDLHVNPETEEQMDERLNDWGRVHWGETP